MKIAFLCGSLEPGRDGVGDYVRRLAGELIRKGHEVAIVALNDSFCSKTIEEVQKDESSNVQVLRLTSTINENLRFVFAKAYIDDYDPDWISLQYVPFSYQSKGLPYKLPIQLKALGRKRKWHIMLHELWVGMEVGASIKHICWGWVQQRIIKLLISNIQPRKLHTQTQLYKAQLSLHSLVCNVLPLFGNIPIVSHPKRLTKITGNILTFVIFGSIHTGAPLQEFAEEVASYVKKNNVQAVLKIIGRSSIEHECWATIWQSNGLAVEVMGEMSAEKISEVLLNGTIGVTTNPITLVEKSGTVAAMIEHGLPVICVRHAWKARGLAKKKIDIFVKGVQEYQPGNLEQCLTNKPLLKVKSTVSEVASMFINDLM